MRAHGPCLAHEKTSRRHGVCLLLAVEAGRSEDCPAVMALSGLSGPVVGVISRGEDCPLHVPSPGDVLRHGAIRGGPRDDRLAIRHAVLRNGSGGHVDRAHSRNTPGDRRRCSGRSNGPNADGVHQAHRGRQAVEGQPQGAPPQAWTRTPVAARHCQ